MGADREFIDWIGDRDFATAWKECPRVDWIRWLWDKKLESLGEDKSRTRIRASHVSPEWTHAEALAFEPADGFGKAVSAYLGQAVAVLCPQWVYRGVVKRVGDNVLVLHPAHGVCVTGSATEAKPRAENPLAGDLFIPLAAIEIVSQPSWASYGIGEKVA